MSEYSQLIKGLTSFRMNVTEQHNSDLRRPSTRSVCGLCSAAPHGTARAGAPDWPSSTSHPRAPTDEQRGAGESNRHETNSCSCCSILLLSSCSAVPVLRAEALPYPSPLERARTNRRHRQPAATIGNPHRFGTRF